MTRLWKVAGYLGLFGLGIVVGRQTAVGVDDPNLRDSLAVYRAERSMHEHERDSLNRVSRAAALRATEAELEANRLLGVAKRSEARAVVHGRRADSLLAMLATARTPAESLAVLVPACTERGLECGALRITADTLRASNDSLKSANTGLAADTAARAAIRRRDSTDLRRADDLVRRLERAARGCRLPLIGFPCPTALLNYDLDAGALQAGAGFPIKRWLTVSVTTPIYRKEPKP